MTKRSSLIGLFLLLALLTLPYVVRAEEAKLTKNLSKIVLQDGDTLVFLGDSLTHQCLYTQYVEDFSIHVIQTSEFAFIIPV